MKNEELIKKHCNQRDNMGDCFLLKETTEAMCAVIAAARLVVHENPDIGGQSRQVHNDLEARLKKFDELVIK